MRSFSRVTEFSQTIDAAAAGMDETRLARIGEHLERRYVQPGKIAGALTQVYRKGHLAYEQALGMMDRERQKPMAHDTLFRIYSMSKPITSIALMQLYEDGHFQLSDPVHRFIPEWRNMRVYVSGRYPNFISKPCDRHMTIKDLLMHTSGLTYDFMMRTNVDAAYRKSGGTRARPGHTLKEMMAELAGIPLEFSPGTAWNYSVSTDVLGYLVEVISGQPFDQYLQTRIFEPLGMVDTGFQVPESDIQRFAACYARNHKKQLVLDDDPTASDYLTTKTFFSGGGGLVSTISDYMSFCRMLVNGGSLNGQRIIGKKTLELMTCNHLPRNEDLTQWATGAFSETANEGFGFGLGFSVNLGSARTGSVESQGAYFWGGAASTIFWIDPKEDMAVVFMTQLMPSGSFNFRGQLNALVYAAIAD
jgi:CubicO group peptidase (beta-lactamase class C family)